MGCNLGAEKLQTCSCKEGVQGISEPVPPSDRTNKPWGTAQPAAAAWPHLPPPPPPGSHPTATESSTSAREGIKVGITIKAAHQPSHPCFCRHVRPVKAHRSCEGRHGGAGGTRANCPEDERLWQAPLSPPRASSPPNGTLPKFSRSAKPAVSIKVSAPVRTCLKILVNYKYS